MSEFRSVKMLWSFLLLILLMSGPEVWAIGKQLEIDLDLEQAPAFISGGLDDDRLGTCLAVGDLDGDGFDDLVLGAPHADDPITRDDRSGSAYVVFGPLPEGFNLDLASITAADATTTATWMTGPDEEDWLGFAVTAGDTNNDGIDDLIVSAPLADGPSNDQEWCGEVLIFHGGPAFRAAGKVEAASADTILYGEDKFDRIGINLTTGDLNGDALPDLLVGAPFGETNAGQLADRLYVFLSPDLQAATEELDINSAKVFQVEDLNRYATGNNNNISIADTNGDGLGDLLVGIPQGENFQSPSGGGEVLLLFGGPHINDITSPLDMGVRDNFDVLWYTDDSYDYLGQSLAVTEADPAVPGNRPWLALGASQADDNFEGEGNTGVVYLLEGGPRLNAATDILLPATTEALDIYGWESHEYTGQSVVFGDVDADGLADLIIGGPLSEGPKRDDDARKGRVYCVFGSTLEAATQPLSLKDDFDLVIYGDRKRDEFGYALAAGKLLDEATPGMNIAASAWMGEGLDPKRNDDTGQAYVFSALGGAPVPVKAGDLNADGRVDYLDVFHLSVPEETAPAAVDKNEILSGLLPLLRAWSTR